MFFYFANTGELRTDCDNLLPNKPSQLRILEYDSTYSWEYKGQNNSLTKGKYIGVSSIEEFIRNISGKRRIYKSSWGGSLEYESKFELQSIIGDTLILNVSKAQSLLDNSERVLDIFFAEAVFNLTEHKGINYVKFQFYIEGKLRSLVMCRKDFEDEFEIEE